MNNKSPDVDPLSAVIVQKNAATVLCDLTVAACSASQVHNQPKQHPREKSRPNQTHRKRKELNQQHTNIIGKIYIQIIGCKDRHGQFLLY